MSGQHENGAMTSSRLKILATAAVLAGAVAFAASPALAVHGLGLFELEGDAVDGGTVPGDDWETVNNGGGHSDLNTFIVDGTGKSIFTQGGSKDVLDIDNWKHTDGNVPDKDDILNAYAASYTSGGDLLIYFGLDRFANEGDATAGFWFFQNEISLNEDGTFNGVHEIGDIFIVADFTSGGDVPVIQIFKWVGGSRKNALELLFSSPDAECLGNPAGDTACANSNAGDIELFWDYTPKGGAPDDPAETAHFFEGGVNISALFSPGEPPCFASFLAETRSSSEPGAQLKDFALGEFPLCAISVTKVCEVRRQAFFNDVDTDGRLRSAFPDRNFIASATISVTNDGSVTIGPDETITVWDFGDPAEPDINGIAETDDDTHIEVLVGSLDKGEDGWQPGETLVILTDAIDTDVPPDGVDDTLVTAMWFTGKNPPMNFFDAEVSFGNRTIEAPDPDPVACSAGSVSQSLFLEKSCSTKLDFIDPLTVVRVLYEGQACNTGSEPLDVTLSDPTVGSPMFPMTVTLDAGFTCTVNSDCDDTLSDGECVLVNGTGVCKNLNGFILGEPVCVEFEGDFLPMTAYGSGGEGEMVPGDAYFTNTVTATAVGTISDIPLNDVSATANCDLCPSKD